MAQSLSRSHDGSFSVVNSFAWILFAVLLTGAAGWGAYHWLGGVDTPLQKAYVGGAAIVGFGVAAWFRKLIPVMLYAAFIVLVIWGAGTYFSR
jgi:hypothetical protein